MYSSKSILAVILFFVIALWSCGDKSPVMERNSPPEVPSNPRPEQDDVIANNVDVRLAWDCIDPDGDAVSFDLYLGPDSEPPLLASGIAINEYALSRLDNSSMYCWRVVASDGEFSTSGPVWRFRIEMTSGIHFVGSYDGYASKGLAVDGNLVFLADMAGFEVIEISNPSAPAYLGGFHPPHQNDSAHDIDLFGDYLYQADGNKGLRIYDISEPANPLMVSEFPDFGYGEDVRVKGDYAYMASGYYFFVVDVSDPFNPTVSGSLHPGNALDNIAVDGEFAYLSDYRTGLKIISISDPEHPLLVSDLAGSGDANGIFFDDNYVYQTVSWNGLEIIDVSNPESPYLISQYQPDGLAQGIYVADGLAYLTLGESGLQILDVSDPAAPTLVESYDTEGVASGVILYDDFIFVSLSSRRGGMLILQYIP